MKNFLVNLLTLNVMKCYAMHTLPRIGAACFWDLKLGNSSLPIVSTLRILSVTFSQDLSWKTQREIVHIKVTSMMNTSHLLAMLSTLIA